MPFNYTTYGLSIRSELELPGLIEGHSQTDVIIELEAYESHPELHLNQTTYHSAQAGHFTFNVRKTAHYIVRNGNSVTVIPHPDGVLEDIRLYLLGTVLAVLIQQRGDLLFHASAISKQGQVILLSGESGVGKSTLAYEMVSNRGWKLCADDVARFSVIGDQIQIYPSYPYMKINEDILDHAGLSKDNFAKVSRKWGKYRIPHISNYEKNPTRARSIFLIQSEALSSLTMQEITGAEKWVQIRSMLYRAEYLIGTTTESKIHTTLSTVSRYLPLIQVCRPIQPFTYSRVKELANSIENYLKAQED